MNKNPFECPDCGTDLMNDGLDHMAMGYLYGAGNRTAVPLHPKLEEKIMTRVQKIIDGAHKIDKDLH